MSKTTNVGMLPCLVTHHSHKVRTLTLKIMELRAGLLKDGCPPELLSDLGVAEEIVTALGTSLDGYKGEQEDAITQVRAANKARRDAEQQARSAARAASKGAMAPAVQRSNAPLPTVEITTQDDGSVMVTTS